MLDSKSFTRGRRFGTFAISLIGSGMTVKAAPPAWWSTGNPPALDPGLASVPSKNASVANIGQAKWMVSEALDALLQSLPDVAHQVMADLNGSLPDQSDRIIDLGIPEEITTAWQDQQRATLSVGQLKAISAPFYERLNTAVPDWLAAQRIANGTNSSGSIYPWTTSTADDSNKALATIGQLKAVFSLRFESLGQPPDTDIASAPDPDQPVEPPDFDTTGSVYSDNDLVVEPVAPLPPPVDGSQAIIYTYKFGRLTGATGPTTATYTHDNTGNILTIKP